MTLTDLTNHPGPILAERLGLRIDKVEGHDLTGPCIACSSSDAFRLHRERGVAHCFSCGKSWSPERLAESRLGDKDRARELMIELGFRKSAPERNQTKREATPAPASDDPIAEVARLKNLTRESLIAYGARRESVSQISLPVFGPDGRCCSRFYLSADGSKGRFKKGSAAGLFFPHVGGVVRLPKPGESWLVVEGPKDAAALHGLGYFACGLNTSQLAVSFTRLFRGVDVVLVPDRDHAGVKGSMKSAQHLQGIAASVHIAVLPTELKPSKGDDVRDVLKLPNGLHLVKQAISDALPAAAFAEIHANSVASSPAMGDSSGPENRGNRTPGSGNREARSADTDGQRQANAADGLGLPGCSFWHSSEGDAYATIPVDDHFENWAVRSSTFKNFVRKQHYDRAGKPLTTYALNAELDLIESKAKFDGPEVPVHVRVAAGGRNIYLDLCNSRWQQVEITPEGWRLIDDSPIKFRRSVGMQALPIPERGGSIDALREFLKVDDDTWTLIVGWLLQCFRPEGPYPLLVLVAEQGSGKSTTAEILRNLIDPNQAPLRADPKDERDLVISAGNSWCLVLDNISRLPAWLSDALCRISTGGGFATRKLYTNNEEMIFQLERPVIITGIEEVVTHSDLLDRSLIVNLPPISDHQRRLKADLSLRFASEQPRILGALLDAVVVALSQFRSVTLPSLPRMADFAQWVTAAETGIGCQPGTFLAAYQRNREGSHIIALESSPIVTPLLELLNASGGWEGTPTKLLAELTSKSTEHLPLPIGWPANAKALSQLLNRITPNLRARGWDAQSSRRGGARTWRFVRIAASPGSRNGEASD